MSDGVNPTPPLHGSWLTVDLNAVDYNLHLLQDHLGKDTHLMAIVKAQGYGTDALAMARHLQKKDVAFLGTAYTYEAIELRQGGIEMPIFVIHAPPSEADAIVAWDLHVGVGRSDLVQALHRATKCYKKPAHAHLMVDTGMRRFGCLPCEALALAKAMAALDGVTLEGVFTHFSSADLPACDLVTQGQIQAFDSVLEDLTKAALLPPWRHAANSPAALRFSLPRCNLARIGLALYGIPPFENARHAFQPALGLYATVVDLMECKKGDTISYGGTYTVQEEHAKIAVLAIGYSDGISQSKGGELSVFLCGQKAPVIGKICMDYLMVEVTHLPSVAYGDVATFFGKTPCGHHLPLEEVASSMQINPRELTCRLGARVKRIF